MNRVQAERLLREAGFIPRPGSRHVQWLKGEIAIGLAGGRLTTDAEAAIRRKLRKAERAEQAQ